MPVSAFVTLIALVIATAGLTVALASGSGALALLALPALALAALIRRRA